MVIPMVSIIIMITIGITLKMQDFNNNDDIKNYNRILMRRHRDDNFKENNHNMMMMLIIIAVVVVIIIAIIIICVSTIHWKQRQLTVNEKCSVSTIITILTINNISITYFNLRQYSFRHQSLCQLIFTLWGKSHCAVNNILKNCYNMTSQYPSGVQTCLAVRRSDCWCLIAVCMFRSYKK